MGDLDVVHACQVQVEDLFFQGTQLRLDTLLKKIKILAVNEDLFRICTVTARRQYTCFVRQSLLQVRSLFSVHFARRRCGCAQGDGGVEGHVFFSAGRLDRCIELAGNA